jgi:hypothetical protein
MEKDPNRFWWLSLLLVAICTVGLWLFQRSVFPATFGGVGLAVDFVLGTAFAALLEDWIDQNSD